MDEIKSQFIGLYNENKRMFKEIALKEASLKFMAQRNRIMEEINAEKKQKLLEERHILVSTICGFSCWPHYCASESWALNMFNKQDPTQKWMVFVIYGKVFPK
jgi:hypothetical protein